MFSSFEETKEAFSSLTHGPVVAEGGRLPAVWTNVESYFTLAVLPSNARMDVCFIEWASALFDSIECANGDNITRSKWPLLEATFGVNTMVGQTGHNRSKGGLCVQHCQADRFKELLRTVRKKVLAHFYDHAHVHVDCDFDFHISLYFFPSFCIARYFAKLLFF
jgi:hypothetical protein